MSGSIAYTIDEIDEKIKELKKEVEKWELRKKQAQNLLNFVKIKRRTNIDSKAGLKKKSKKRRRRRSSKRRRKSRK